METRTSVVVSVPAQCFVWNWTLAVPHDGGGLASHTYALTLPPVLHYPFFLLNSLVVLKTISWHIWQGSTLNFNSNTHTHKTSWQTCKWAVFHQTHQNPWRGSSCFTCIALPSFGGILTRTLILRTLVCNFCLQHLSTIFLFLFFFPNFDPLLSTSSIYDILRHLSNLSLYFNLV